MNIDLSVSSVVQWFEATEKHRCGYCKNESSITHGMWAESLTVDDYQDLIDRGWRRSGKYCYKSIMDETCCPLYTIKCDAVNFSLSKSQKKVIKKFNKFLRDGEINKDPFFDTQFIDDPENTAQIPKEHPKINLSNISTSIAETVINTTSTSPGDPSTSKRDDICNVNKETSVRLFDKPVEVCDNEVTDSSQKSNVKTTFKEGIGADPNKPPCKKAKLLRIERKKQKGSIEKDTIAVQIQKSLEDFLEEVLSDDQIKKLRITVERMSRSCNAFDVSAELYKKYQTHIHNDPPEECDEEQFYTFLVETPLQPKSFPEGVDGPGYGSFHQQYWIDDTLIAVGVIDILPKCVSSVYFFYDPDYRSLTLGTYGSLREVELTRKLQKTLPDLSNYYMGFYIHSCPKMRYKGKLTPSYLVCPETYRWIPIEKCIPLLDANKYARLDDDIDAIDSNLPSNEDISHIKIVYKFRLIQYRDFNKHQNDSERFRNIGNLIGKKCCKSLIFWEQ